MFEISKGQDRINEWIYIPCTCHHVAHAINLMRLKPEFSDEHDLNECEISLSLDSSVGLFTRLKYAFNYVFFKRHFTDNFYASIS